MKSRHKPTLRARLTGWASINCSLILNFVNSTATKKHPNYFGSNYMFHNLYIILFVPPKNANNIFQFFFTDINFVKVWSIWSIGLGIVKAFCRNLNVWLTMYSSLEIQFNLSSYPFEILANLQYKEFQFAKLCLCHIPKYVLRINMTAKLNLFIIGRR